MLELLFLLLPVAAAYGWYMGRRGAQQDKQQNADRLSREYVAGVNFFLINKIKLLIFSSKCLKKIALLLKPILL